MSNHLKVTWSMMVSDLRISSEGIRKVIQTRAGDRILTLSGMEFLSVMELVLVMRVVSNKRSHILKLQLWIWVRYNLSVC